MRSTVPDDLPDAVAVAIYDTILPGWLEAPRSSQGNRRLRAPYREDEHASLDVHPDKLVWYDRGTGEGGGAVALARKTLGEEGARELLRRIGNVDGQPVTRRPDREPAREPKVEELGPATSAQIAILKRSRRLRDGDTLDRLGAKALRVAWPRDNGEFGLSSEWLGLPLVNGGFKLLALDRNGNQRLDDRGRLIRRNVGPVSFLASPILREGNGGPVRRLLDVEGESDCIAPIEVGFHHVISTSGGAASLAAHEQDRDWLTALEPAEVAIVRDLDDPGRNGAAKAADWWLALGIPVRVVELPEALGEGGDLRDYLNGCPARDGRPAAEPLGGAAELEALIDAAPIRRASSQPTKTLPSEPSSEHLTDLGNARRLVSQQGSDLRYCHVSKRWLVWDGSVWAPDTTGEVMRRAKAAVGTIYAEAAQASDADIRKAIAAHARKSENERQLKAMIALAASEPDVPVCPDDLDQDPLILNVENGTIDLRTGELRPHRRADLLTKIISVNYDPSARSELWERFLERIIPDASVRDFLQRAVGYSLTGLTVEQVLFLLWGTGANGKTTFIETEIGLLGGYSLKTPADTLLARRDTGIPNDVAALRGARLVAAVEMEDGRRLAEVRVKEITGGDTISARFMRGEWFTFRPACKVWLASNHRPVVRGTDHAIWRRLRLIPFTETITDSERDPHLIEKLKGELTGVLTWAVEGCLAWQREGLKAPDSVLIATQEYRQEQDLLGEFFRDRCVLAEGAWTSAADLYRAYCDWDEGGRAVMSKRQLGLRLRERGFDDVRKGKSRTRAWLGIGLVDPQHGDTDDDGEDADVAG